VNGYRRTRRVGRWMLEGMVRRLDVGRIVRSKQSRRWRSGEGPLAKVARRSQPERSLKVPKYRNITRNCANWGRPSVARSDAARAALASPPMSGIHATGQIDQALSWRSHPRRLGDARTASAIDVGHVDRGLHEELKIDAEPGVRI